MARRKRQHPFLALAQTYLTMNMPEMAGARLQVRMLDGPPGGPRYAVMAELCPRVCPRGTPPALAAAGKCGEADCPLRRSVRLLFDRRGTMVQASRSGIHWS